MSAKTVKIAISLPKATLDEIESLRHRLHWPRSRAIVEAVSFWLKKKREEAMDRKCAEGYKRMPEDKEEMRAFYRAGLASFDKEEW